MSDQLFVRPLFSLDRGPAEMMNDVGDVPPIRRHQFFCQRDNLFCKTSHMFIPFLFVKVFIWQRYFARGEELIIFFFWLSFLHCFEFLSCGIFSPFRPLPLLSICCLLHLQYVGGRKWLCFCSEFWRGKHLWCQQVPWKHRTWDLPCIQVAGLGMLLFVCRGSQNGEKGTSEHHLNVYVCYACILISVLCRLMAYDTNEDICYFLFQFTHLPYLHSENLMASTPPFTE